MFVGMGYVTLPSVGELVLIWRHNVTVLFYPSIVTEIEFAKEKKSGNMG